MVIDFNFSPVDREARKTLDLRAGDTVRVTERVKEGAKTRKQMFEGVVLARKHGREPGATFTLRKVSGGIGVERVFLLYSPVLEDIKILKRPARVRRAKLYYLRHKTAKETRKKIA
ncbi:MAG: 50S ribosomal protein L19 [Patescibacteria group bacterium]